MGVDEVDRDRRRPGAADDGRDLVALGDVLPVPGFRAAYLLMFVGILLGNARNLVRGVLREGEAVVLAARGALPALGAHAIGPRPGHDLTALVRERALRDLLEHAAGELTALLDDVLEHDPEADGVVAPDGEVPLVLGPGEEGMDSRQAAAVTDGADVEAVQHARRGSDAAEPGRGGVGLVGPFRVEVAGSAGPVPDCVFRGLFEVRRGAGHELAADPGPDLGERLLGDDPGEPRLVCLHQISFSAVGLAWRLLHDPLVAQGIDLRFIQIKDVLEDLRGVLAHPR
jgi:hypothetical protein